MHITLHILLIGVGATLLMDLWTLLLRYLGVTTLNYAMIGRWAGHLRNGQWRHPAISRAPAIVGERAAGWLLHYATGLLFALILVALVGKGWLLAPAPLPALLFGLVTVLVPLCVIQPALGTGYFAARTPRPLISCLRSLGTHGVFGAGLYLAAVAALRVCG